MISAAIGVSLAHHASGAAGGSQARPHQLRFASSGGWLDLGASVSRSALADSSKTPINHVERTPNTELRCLTPAKVRSHRRGWVFSIGSNQLIQFGRLK
jgi:hypothetical protein